MIKRIVLPVILAGAGIGSYLIFAPGSKTETATVPTSEVGAAATVVTPSNAIPAASAPAHATTLSAKEDIKGPISESAERSKEAWEQFSHEPDLEAYSHLRRKVFMTDEEKKQHKDLLQNRAFLESLKDIVLVEAPEDKTSLQNSALDFLFESLKSGQKNISREILQAVVQDATVENSSESLSTRKSVGGVKAEVIYQWSSIEPQSASVIEQSLPGPVSKKIWIRVQEQQESNAGESANLQASK